MKNVEKKARTRPKPTVQNIDHIVCVPLKAAVPLVEDNTANTTQTQQQGSLQGFLQGQLSCTGEERNNDIVRDREFLETITNQTSIVAIVSESCNIYYVTSCACQGSTGGEHWRCSEPGQRAEPCDSLRRADIIQHYMATE